jgi:beta-barrel assembly-enhancing protease
MTLKPIVGENYVPIDADEKGMWQQASKAEEKFASSDLLVTDNDLKELVSDIIVNLIGARAKSFRIYVIRSNEFNAFMDPSGFCVVFTSLLTRMRSEDQLAGVLGHEASHYLLRHAVRRWRDAKKKLAIRNFGTLAIGYSGILARQDTSDLILNFGNSIIYSLYAYDRQTEQEADALGLRLLAEAGYYPGAMAEIWRQAMEEEAASAAARGKKHAPEFSLLATHPSNAERMADMTASAREVESAIAPPRRRADRLSATLRVHRQLLLSDLVKLNDSGSSFYILGYLLKNEPSGVVQFYVGETFRLRDMDGDEVKALSAYESALSYADVPPEVYRELGNLYLKAARPADGKRALTRYLELAPNATDAAMVRFTLKQEGQ